MLGKLVYTVTGSGAKAVLSQGTILDEKADGYNVLKADGKNISVSQKDTFVYEKEARAEFNKRLSAATTDEPK